MQTIADGLSSRGWMIHRFAFPYMQRSRELGRRRPPDRAPVLLQCMRDVVRQLDSPIPLFLGGKSIGGRMASLLLDELSAEGAGILGGICLGYPFHPLGKPLQTRVDHLKVLQTPCLIVQGERDAMGRKDEVLAYGLEMPLQLRWIPDGDHSFTPRKSSGRSEALNLSCAVEVADEFMRNLIEA